MLCGSPDHHGASPHGVGEATYYPNIEVTSFPFDEPTFTDSLHVTPVNDASVVHEEVACQIAVAEVISDSCCEI